MWYQVNAAIREVVAVGAWGPAIFSDDVAADIREDWRLHIGDGLSPEAATTRIIEQYADAVKDQDEAGVVWLALAVSQWRTGRLLPEVQARAIEVIDNGADLRRWESADPKTRRARAQVLAKTRDQLLSPPPETKRIPRRRRSRTPYGAGDVLRYRHRSGREFVFWVSRNVSDIGGEYNYLEVLDLGGSAVPSLSDLHRYSPLKLGAALRRPGDPIQTGRIGLSLIHASMLGADRITLIGNVAYPPGRPRFDAWGASARDVDDVLYRLLSDGDQ
jgi:hypothetical protein